MRKILFFILLCLCGANVAQAQQKTVTGFYYPIGQSTWNHACGAWLARDGNHGGCYFLNEYHIGEDMLTPQGSSAYAISQGTITYRSTSGWGTGNIALVIKHKLSDGSEFLALYGHIVSSKQVGNTVNAGDVIGTIGHWDNGDHLHFGIHPGLTMPNNNWGEMPDGSWPAYNGFVDPVNWITTKAPFGTGTLTDLYVNSVTGSDGNAGTSGSPFATVTKAVSTASDTAPTVIHVKGGRYKITSSLTIHKNIRIVNDGGGVVYVGK